MKSDVRLCCLSGWSRGSSERLDLDRVARAFPFVRKDSRFGGRLCVAQENATVWIYRSGKITVLGREVGSAKAAYVLACRGLEESGDSSNVGNPTSWNVLRQAKANAGKRLSLKKLASRIPESRFERTQRAVLCRLDDGVHQVPGKCLVEIYGSGKLLVRGRNEGPLPESVRDLIPTIEDSG